MADTKNALAELAEKLKYDEDVLRTYKEELGVGDNMIGGLVIADIRKASRIVAELAKVDTVPDGNGKQKTACFEGCDAVDRCRAIAEEGAEGA